MSQMGHSPIDYEDRLWTFCRRLRLDPEDYRSRELYEQHIALSGDLKGEDKRDMMVFILLTASVVSMGFGVAVGYALKRSER